VSTIATALPTRRRPALRPLIVAAVVLALIAAALVAYVGSRPRPAPLLGLARNGPVLITDSGSIVEVDLTTGSKRTLASGTNLCCAHVSPDGLRFSYSHVPSPGADPVGLTIANFDGSVIRVIPDDVADASWYQWSPGGDKLLLTRATGGDVIDIATGAVTAVAPDIGPYEVLRASWIGTSGDIAFISNIADTPQTGMTVRFSRLQAGATTGAREVGTAQHFVSDAGVSPDGSKLLYFIWGPEVRLQGKLHVIDLVTGDDRAITPEVDVPQAEITEWENPVWSPDGSHIAAEVYTAGPNHIAVIPATGGDPVFVGPEFPTGTGGAQIRFSPDGQSLMATYNHNGETWLLPVSGAAGRLLPWAAEQDDIGWQRLAP